MGAIPKTVAIGGEHGKPETSSLAAPKKGAGSAKKRRGLGYMKMAKLDLAEIALRREELTVLTESGDPVWATTVLRMGACDRNRMIKQLQLNEKEITELKVTTRLFKQNAAQKRYRRNLAAVKTKNTAGGGKDAAPCPAGLTIAV